MSVTLSHLPLSIFRRPRATPQGGFPAKWSGIPPAHPSAFDQQSTEKVVVILRHHGPLIPRSTDQKMGSFTFDCCPSRRAKVPQGYLLGGRQKRLRPRPLLIGAAIRS